MLFLWHIISIIILQKKTHAILLFFDEQQQGMVEMVLMVAVLIILILANVLRDLGFVLFSCFFYYYENVQIASPARFLKDGALMAALVIWT